MQTKEAIFIFTRDRPEILINTLKSLQHISYFKYVIDDSVQVENKIAVSNICNDISNCTYLGNDEFHGFCKAHQISLSEFPFLLRSLGNSKWSLGFARNFAMLYSKAVGFEKVLFSDDDIEVPNANLIAELFESINYYKFTGANISGLVDDSVLGHIATDMGVINERMLSGGFMVFNPDDIEHFFMNNYNEDWIWLFLQLKNNNYLQTGEVLQQLADPLTDYKQKVIFQEFGEIALDGILDLSNADSFDSLTDLAFWERIVKERNEYLDFLEAKAVEFDNPRYAEIIRWVKNNSAHYNAIVFQKLFEKYFLDRNEFLKLYKAI